MISTCCEWVTVWINQSSHSSARAICSLCCHFRTASCWLLSRFGSSSATKSNLLGDTLRNEGSQNMKINHYRLCQNGTNKIGKRSKWDPIWGGSVIEYSFFPRRKSMWFYSAPLFLRDKDATPEKKWRHKTHLDFQERRLWRALWWEKEDGEREREM